MEFFTDFNVDKTSKIGITNLLGNITTKDHSHKGGWTKLLRCQLINEGYEDVIILDKTHKLDQFDCIVYDLGAEFSGGLNLFGGLDEKTVNRLVELDLYKGLMFSWQHKLPDIYVLNKRRANKSTHESFMSAFSEDRLHALNDKILKVKSFDHVAKKSKILIGDSHTPSVWTPEYMIERRDGRTLSGMVNHDTIDKVINKHLSTGNHITDVTVYAGNIDIRHHILREEAPWNYIQRLASQLIDKCAYYQTIRFEIIHALPIENESRKLPKTGFFKGTPFYGTWNERSAAVEIFNNILNANQYGISVYNHPKDFYNDKGELTFDVMERPQSVHLSPMHYRWDLDNNKLRYL